MSRLRESQGRFPCRLIKAPDSPRPSRWPPYSVIRMEPMTTSHLDETVVRRLLEAEQEAVHPLLIRWFGKEGVRRNLADVLHATERRMRGGRLLSGSQPVIVEEEGVGTIIAEPRFVADNLTFPFLQVLHHDVTFSTVEDITRLSDVLFDAFAAFAPQRICIYVHQSLDLQPVLRKHPLVRSYKRYIAASVRDLLASPPPPLASRIRLERPETLDFYDEYSLWYDEFWRESPSLRDVVRRESRDAMKQYLEAGALQLVWLDGAMAGVVAAAREMEYGLRGWCMHERIIRRQERGQGWGTAVMHAFVKSLPSSSDEALWGTVAAGNIPSSRTALRLGRVDVGGLVWIDAP
jgi:hypothetical protein